LTRSVPQAFWPAPEGAAVLFLGPARALIAAWTPAWIGLPDDRPRRGGQSRQLQHTPPFRVRILFLLHFAGRLAPTGGMSRLLRTAHICAPALLVSARESGGVGGAPVWAQFGHPQPGPEGSGSSIALQPLFDWLDCQPLASCGCGCPPRTFLVAVTAHPAPSGGRCADLGSSGDRRWRVRFQRAVQVAGIEGRRAAPRAGMAPAHRFMTRSRKPLSRSLRRACSPTA